MVFCLFRVGLGLVEGIFRVCFRVCLGLVLRFCAGAAQSLFTGKFRMYLGLVRGWFRCYLGLVQGFFRKVYVGLVSGVFKVGLV